jgi:predicted phage terminase large subunit-like protein
MEDYKGIQAYLRKHPHSLEAYEDWFELARANGDIDICRDILKGVTSVVGNPHTKIEEKYRGHDLMKRLNLMLAPKYFHHYCIYLEWNRDPKKRFYQPRMKALYPLVREMQKLEDDELDLLCISLPPGVGKTTLALFFLSWIGGKHPDMQMLESSHNVAFLRGCYDELLRICDPDGEYLYADVFPNSPVVETNAKDLRIDLQTSKRFQTFQLTSVGAGNAGKVRATKLLYCDDLVDGIETAVNPVQLDKLWNLYATDLRQRKQGDVCKELHIATRWSVNDVIGRLEMMYGTDPRAKFINVPALNGLGQSNFDYPYGLGFSTEMYKAQKEAMSELDWNAIYMGIPVERDALLFPREELQRFMELPTDEPDAVFAVCDTKDKGDDYFCMPIVYQYGERFFLADVVYDNRLPDVVIPRMARKLVEHGVKQCRFESNSAGGRIALEVDRLVKENGGFTNITTKYTTANKQTKILVNADFAKNYILYKDDSACDREYLAFLNGLCSYTHVGKNLHDDAPDAMAMFADYIQSGVGNRIEIRKRPF